MAFSRKPKQVRKNRPSSVEWKWPNHQSPRRG
jgi:hypothetical protein